VKKFWQSKKNVFLALVLLVAGLFIYFFWFAESEFPWEKEKLPEEIKNDNVPPSTAITSPEDKSWWSRDFKVTINDSDLGSGLVEYLFRESGCKYIIEDLGTGEAIGGFRQCDPVEINIPVGKEKICSSSYQKNDISQGKCKVSTIAFDKADNNSGWKSKVFNIDLIEPEVDQINSVNQSLELDKTYLLEASISDNSKITGCWFYLDGGLTEEKVKIEPIPCQDDNRCRVSLGYSFDEEDEYLIGFGCTDIAGNFSFGEPLIIKVVTNHPPQISSCKVTPSQGNLLTSFQFSVEATDWEGDELFYTWDFGDGETSSEKNPFYSYLISGTYEPKVIVSDGKGGEVECSTAWVVVSQD